MSLYHFVHICTFALLVFQCVQLPERWENILPRQLPCHSSRRVLLVFILFCLFYSLRYHNVLTHIIFVVRRLRLHYESRSIALVLIIGVLTGLRKSWNYFLQFFVTQKFLEKKP